MHARLHKHTHTRTHAHTNTHISCKILRALSRSAGINCAQARACAYTNVERKHITRLTISSAEARRIVRYADACRNLYVTRTSTELFGRPLSAFAEYAATSDRRNAPSFGLLWAQTLFFSRHIRVERRCRTYVNTMQLIRYARSRRIFVVALPVFYSVRRRYNYCQARRSRPQ